MIVGTTSKEEFVQMLLLCSDEMLTEHNLLRLANITDPSLRWLHVDDWLAQNISWLKEFITITELYDDGDIEFKLSGWGWAALPVEPYYGTLYELATRQGISVNEVL